MGYLKCRWIESMEPKEEPPMGHMKDLYITIYGGGEDAVEAAKKLSTAGEWIAASERMPEDESMVLVWSQSNGLHLAYLDSYRQWRDADMNFGKKITHWMPLPEPPEATASISLGRKHTPSATNAAAGSPLMAPQDGWHGTNGHEPPEVK